MFNDILVDLQNGNYYFAKSKIAARREVLTFSNLHGQGLIHITAKIGCLEVLKFILEIDSSQLNLVDGRNIPPISYAASEGHNHVIRYLLGLNVEINYLNESLIFAAERRKYSSANLIIHHLLDDENRGTIFNFISSAAEAIEYILLDSRNQALILSNPRIRSMLQENPRNGLITFFKPQGRRPSFYVEINPESNDVKFFSKDRVIGQGCNGRVYSFVSQDNQKRAVKYDLDGWDYSSEYLEDGRCEVANRNLAYPGSNSFFLLSRPVLTAKGQAIQYGSRDVSEFIDGVTLSKFFPGLKDITEITCLILSIVAELQRIHATVIHGDVKEDNIMVYEKDGLIKVRFVDFGCSSKITDIHAQTFKVEQALEYMAPERWSFNRTPILTPHPNQDVYSLAYMFRSLLSRHVDLQEELSNFFPSIQNFITGGLITLNPEQRPTLQGFYDNLNRENRDYIARRQAINELSNFLGVS